MILKAVAALAVSAAGIAAVAMYRPGDANGGDASEAASAPAAPAPAAGKGMLPDRLLDCHLGRIANFDPDKDQKVADFKFEGNHTFKLFLPSIPERTTPPPDSTAPPEPVDPRTRVVADPDGLKSTPAPFDRVVDLWPKRVEMTAPVAEQVSSVVVIDQVDLTAGTASMFVTTANDAVTFDQKRMYSGKCTIATGAAAVAAAG